jgi:hypothetical protein
MPYLDATAQPTESASANRNMEGRPYDKSHDRKPPSLKFFEALAAMHRLQDGAF